MVKFEFLGKLKGDGGEEGEKSIEETIKDLSDQGYSQNEITEKLRDEGYAYSDINQAMNNVIKDSAERDRGSIQENNSMSRGAPNPDRGQEPMSPVERGMDQGGYQDNYGNEPVEREYQDEPTQRPPEENFEEPVEDEWSPDIGISSDEEALIETIIEEKLLDIEDEFENVYGEIDDMMKRLKDIEETVHDLKTRREEDEKEFIQKVSQIEEYMEDSHSRIGGMEKAFQQTLPSLVENVRDLTDIVEDMKKGK